MKIETRQARRSKASLSWRSTAAPKLWPAALSGFISGAATGLVGGTRIDIATAYFNVGGYVLIADSLDDARETRLLLGAEPEPAENRPRRLSVGAGQTPQRPEGRDCWRRWRITSRT